VAVVLGVLNVLRQARLLKRCNAGQNDTKIEG
jgi:hypothetical protein